MPTYEYLCKNCGERFEKFQKFSAKPLKTHDACGGEVQKVFHASGVVFKGPGFYATDSRAASRASKDSTSDGSTKDSASKDSSSKDKVAKETSSGSTSKESKSSSTAASAAAAD